MSDAPETDAVWLDSFQSTRIDAEKVRDFARKLERERNEARALVGEMREALELGMKLQSPGDIWSVEPSQMRAFIEAASVAIRKAKGGQP